MSARKEQVVRLVYLDDSADDSGVQMVGAIVVPENKFMVIEEYLAHLIDELVPEELREKFEFHASAMFHAKPPFSGLTRDTALEIFSRCTSIVEKAPIDVIYGAVNLGELRACEYATAQPVDVAFRKCLEGIAEWFPEHFSDEIGMLIFDDTQNQGVKTNLQKAFRAYRRRLKSDKHERGLLEWVHDDMYFGDSAYSVGIQLADICSFIILRHLQGKEDTEFLYKRIESRIFYGVTAPWGIPHGNSKILAKVAQITPS